MFMPADRKLMNSKAFDCINFTRLDALIKSFSLLQNNGTAWQIEPLIIQQWHSLKLMLMTFTKIFISNLYPLDTYYLQQPSSFLGRNHFSSCKYAVDTAICTQQAFIISTGFLFDLMAYNDLKMLDAFNSNTFWYSLPDILQSVFKQTQIFSRTHIKQVGAFVNGSVKCQWWNMLRYLFCNSDVLLWPFFGSQIPQSVANDQLLEFCPTQAEVEESLVKFAFEWLLSRLQALSLHSTG